VEVIQLLQDLIIDVCGIVLVFNGHVNGIPRKIIFSLYKMVSSNQCVHCKEAIPKIRNK
jgi:hypothetical protein